MTMFRIRLRLFLVTLWIELGKIGLWWVNGCNMKADQILKNNEPDIKLLELMKGEANGT